MIGGMVVGRILRAYREAYTGLPREVWLLAAATLVNRSGTMVLPFMSLYLTRSLGYTASQAGQLLALYGVGSMVGSAAGGWLADRLGAVRVQMLSLVGTGFAFLVVARLTGFTALAVAIPLLSAIADAFRPALMAAVARRSAPEVQARSFALLRLAINLGMSVGPALGGFLAVYSYRWLFAIDALTCWAAAVVLALTLGLGADRRAEAAARPVAVPRSPWRDWPFLAFLLLVVLLGMAFFQLFSTMPLYLRDFYRVTERAVGGLIALNTVMIVLLEMVLLRTIGERDPLRVAAWGGLLVCAGMALFPLGPAKLVAVAAMTVATFGEMLSLPVSNAVVARRAGSGAAGRYMGAYTLAFSASLVLGPALGTEVYEHLGGGVLFLGVGGFGLILWLGFQALAPRFHGSARTAS
jgi:predicted MFS family arabinose efflux permease